MLQISSRYKLPWPTIIQQINQQVCAKLHHISESNITSSNESSAESTNYTTDSTRIHVKCKGKHK
jgi:hypothetical protein